MSLFNNNQNVHTNHLNINTNQFDNFSQFDEQGNLISITIPQNETSGINMYKVGYNCEYSQGYECCFEEIDVNQSNEVNKYAEQDNEMIQFEIGQIIPPSYHQHTITNPQHSKPYYEPTKIIDVEQGLHSSNQDFLQIYFWNDKGNQNFQLDQLIQQQKELNNKSYICQDSYEQINNNIPLNILYNTNHNNSNCQIKQNKQIQPQQSSMIREKNELNTIIDKQLLNDTKRFWKQKINQFTNNKQQSYGQSDNISKSTFQTQSNIVQSQNNDTNFSLESLFNQKFNSNSQKSYDQIQYQVEDEIQKQFKPIVDDFTNEDYKNVINNISDQTENKEQQKFDVQEINSNFFKKIQKYFNLKQEYYDKHKQEILEPVFKYIKYLENIFEEQIKQYEKQSLQNSRNNYLGNLFLEQFSFYSQQFNNKNQYSSQQNYDNQNILFNEQQIDFSYENFQQDFNRLYDYIENEEIKKQENDFEENQFILFQQIIQFIKENQIQYQQKKEIILNKISNYATQLEKNLQYLIKNEKNFKENIIIGLDKKFKNKDGIKYYKDMEETLLIKNFIKHLNQFEDYYDKFILPIRSDIKAHYLLFGQCFQEFSQKNSKKATNNKKFQCICGKQYNYQASLEQHTIIHQFPFLNEQQRKEEIHYLWLYQVEISIGLGRNSGKVSKLEDKKIKQFLEDKVQLREIDLQFQLLQNINQDTYNY